MYRLTWMLTIVTGFSLLLSSSTQAGEKKVKTLRPLYQQPSSATYSQAKPTTRPAQSTDGRVPKLQGNPISDKLNTIYERTDREFRNAIFYKPSDQTAAEQDRAMAPLLVQEVGDNASAASLHIGAVESTAEGRLQVDTKRPTVYSSEGYARLGDSYCRQFTHLWATPSEDGKTVEWHGVRTTYGPSRWPLTWEVLSTKDEPVILFVSKTFEEAARKQFGKPPTGRRQAAERSRDQQPNVVVARMLPDGREPMGPVVYQDAAEKDVTTLLCRCMKAQVDNFVENTYYEILPIDLLTDVHVANNGPFRLEKGPATGKPDPEHPWLEQALRVANHLD